VFLTSSGGARPRQAQPGPAPRGARPERFQRQPLATLHRLQKPQSRAFF
jgi:hypothetical protein